ncbi:hypothetical protein P691DRAFT_765466 [Macrolepiota fuliginosa MF-IS2]|uniref:Uncharacterized protein n=1 Tax=Macrolepiota fuliginosa MF-IS2 TaxID=1400762 RepID=A0A9P6BWR5_9AGAR|nr:hypothetical protein P691DRAFT_765466 [Macrolepiota fuliginosa MF-IS2]
MARAPDDAYLPFSDIPHSYSIETTPYSRSKQPFMSGSSICILVYRLQGLGRDSCTSRLVYGHLKTYFLNESPPNALDLIEIEFDLETEEGRNMFEAQQMEAASNLQSYSRFIVFIWTHTTFDTGMFYTSKTAELGLQPPTQFLELLFPGSILQHILRDRMAGLIFIACGGPFAKPERRMEVFRFASK